MTILLYIVSALMIVAGLSIFTKSRNPTTAKMGRFEHLLLCLCFIAGGITAITTERWLYIFVAIGLSWVIYSINESKRKRMLR